MTRCLIALLFLVGCAQSPTEFSQKPNFQWTKGDDVENGEYYRPLRFLKDRNDPTAVHRFIYLLPDQSV